jgi:hypothetical protein
MKEEGRRRKEEGGRRKEEGGRRKDRTNLRLEVSLPLASRLSPFALFC